VIGEPRKISSDTRKAPSKCLIILLVKKLLTLPFGRRTFPASQSQHLVFACGMKTQSIGFGWLRARRLFRSETGAGDGDNGEIKDFQRYLSGNLPAAALTGAFSLRFGAIEWAWQGHIYPGWRSIRTSRYKKTGNCRSWETTS
jgi:hypothetical protein